MTKKGKNKSKILDKSSGSKPQAFYNHDQQTPQAAKQSSQTKVLLQGHHESYIYF